MYRYKTFLFHSGQLSTSIEAHSRWSRNLSTVGGGESEGEHFLIDVFPLKKYRTKNTTEAVAPIHMSFNFDFLAKDCFLQPKLGDFPQGPVFPVHFRGVDSEQTNTLVISPSVKTEVQVDDYGVPIYNSAADSFVLVNRCSSLSRH